MRRKNFRKVPFAGLQHRDEVSNDELPTAFINGMKDYDSVEDVTTTFADLYHNELDRAQTVPTGWQNPAKDDSWEMTEQFNAVINIDALMRAGGSVPEQSEDGVPWADDPFEAEGDEEVELNEEDILLNVPTESYEIINPAQFYGPLEDALVEENMTDVFGWANIERRGGEAHIHLLFTGEETDLPDGAGDSMFTGLRTGFSHFGDTAAYAAGFAQDTTCSNSLRYLTDRKSRRHVGEAAVDDVDWWTELLQDYGAITDFMLEAIEQALDIEWELDEMPFENWADLFELAGYPEYLARSMASHADNRSADPWTMNAWEAYCGATYGLTHTYRGNEESQTAEGYYRTANDFLQNPQMVFSEVESEYRRRQAETDMSDEELESNLAQIQQASSDLEDLREEQEVKEEQLRKVLIGGDTEEEDADSEPEPSDGTADDPPWA